MEKKITLSEFPIPQAVGVENQIIADIIFLPETLLEAERIITEDMFTDNKCRNAWNALRAMSREGKNIDLASAFSVLDKDLMTHGILPLSNSVGSAVSTLQHFGALKNLYIKRKCYFAALDMLKGSSDYLVPAKDVISKAINLSDQMQREYDSEGSTKHISDVINELAESIEEAQRNKAEGKPLRVPTGFVRLDFLTYGGFNRGNLVILAARPSVGKTAIMLHMAKAAAISGKSVNLFNLEMTNAELAQRFLYSTGDITPLEVAKGEVVWDKFESASGQFSGKPIYLNDSASTIDEIISHITLNAQADKCDIAFIDYLGLINVGDSARMPLNQAIATCTKRLKQTAKLCKIPIVLLCQLNRASVSEKRSPALYDLRDSGSIEQDADIVLMLERATSIIDDDDTCRDINMWVRKNRQGKAGEINVEIVANETFTAFEDKAAPVKLQAIETTPVMDSNTDFDNFPF